MKDPDHLKIRAYKGGIFEQAETYYFTLNSMSDTQHLQIYASAKIQKVVQIVEKVDGYQKLIDMA